MIDATQLDEDLRIDEGNLNASFLNQAGLLASYAGTEYRLAKAVGQREIALDIIRAQLDKEIRDAATVSSAKITEKMIESQIDRDKGYVTAKLALIEAKAMLGLAKRALDAFDHRKDMLVQLGAGARKEMDGELRLRASSADRVSAAFGRINALTGAAAE